MGLLHLGEFLDERRAVYHRVISRSSWRVLCSSLGKLTSVGSDHSNKEFSQQYLAKPSRFASDFAKTEHERPGRDAAKKGSAAGPRGKLNPEPEEESVWSLLHEEKGPRHDIRPLRRHDLVAADSRCLAGFLFRCLPKHPLHTPFALLTKFSNLSNCYETPPATEALAFCGKNPHDRFGYRGD